MRECLAIVVARWLRSIDVLEPLAELFVLHGVPAHIRSEGTTDVALFFLGDQPMQPDFGQSRIDRDRGWALPKRSLVP